MSELITDIVKRYIESFLNTIPKITNNWFILSKILFYCGSILVYVLTFLVLMSVVLIILIIAVPVSIIHKNIP